MVSIPVESASFWQVFVHDSNNLRFPPRDFPVKTRGAINLAQGILGCAQSAIAQLFPCVKTLQFPNRHRVAFGIGKTGKPASAIVLRINSNLDAL
jgi:hypothetical protein